MAKQLDTGALSERIEIQEPTEARNDYGEELITWAQVACVWANVAYTNAGNREAVFGDQETAVTRTVFTIWHRDGLTEKHRVVYASQNYDIMTIQAAGGHRNRLQLICEKRI